MAANDLQQRGLRANGIGMHIAEQGAGPLVLLCHGFPEGRYSWRHQLPAIAAAGYHAVAPDMRGYGRTDAPPDVAAYGLMDIVGDMVGLVSALGEQQAINIGHDWGASIAWHAALFRPDVFPAVAALSVPFRQRGPARPLDMLRKAGLFTHYWFHFQEPGVAEAECEQDPRATLRRIYYSISGDAPADVRGLALHPGKGWLANSPDPVHPSPWFTEQDLDHAAAEFSRSGFRGGLNWYRNIDRNWDLTAPWAGAIIRQPALFLAGSSDPVIAPGFGASALAALPHTVPGLRRTLIIDGAGHFIQQERPQIVNQAILEFLRGL
jgi:pimeloyl-ACP methyl ester carboxylesterase